MSARNWTRRVNHILSEEWGFRLEDLQRTVDENIDSLLDDLYSECNCQQAVAALRRRFPVVFSMLPDCQQRIPSF